MFRHSIFLMSVLICTLWCRSGSCRNRILGPLIQIWGRTFLRNWIHHFSNDGSGFSKCGSTPLIVLTIHWYWLGLWSLNLNLWSNWVASCGAQTSLWTLGTIFWGVLRGIWGGGGGQFNVKFLYQNQNVTPFLCQCTLSKNRFLIKELCIGEKFL